MRLIQHHVTVEESWKWAWNALMSWERQTFVVWREWRHRILLEMARLISVAKLHQIDSNIHNPGPVVFVHNKVKSTMEDTRTGNYKIVYFCMQRLSLVVRSLKQPLLLAPFNFSTLWVIEFSYFFSTWRWSAVSWWYFIRRIRLQG